MEVNTLSRHRESLQMLQHQVDYVTNVSKDFTHKFEAQRLSEIEIVDRLDAIDGLLLQTVNELTTFVVSNSNESAERWVLGWHTRNGFLWYQTATIPLDLATVGAGNWLIFAADHTSDKT